MNLVDGTGGFVVLARRTPFVPGAEDPLDFWRAGPYWTYGADPELRREVVEEWRDEPGALLMDVFTQRIVQGHGEPRSFRRIDLVDDDEWEGSSSKALCDELGIGDRIVSGLPVSYQCEMFVGVERPVDHLAFTPTERCRVRASLHGLTPMARQLAATFGLLEKQKQLSPREHETLLYLLEGASEREASEKLGVSEATAHQYVVSIYRKLRVSSRAELLALWLGDDGSDAASPPAFQPPRSRGGH